MRDTTTHEDIIEASPIRTTVHILGGKYKPVILSLLAERPGYAMRFSEIQEVLHDVTPRMLSKHLRELEADLMVRRTVLERSPLKVEYSLTPTGMSVIPVIEAMSEWGAAYQEMARERGADPRGLSGSSRWPG